MRRKVRWSGRKKKRRRSKKRVRSRTNAQKQFYSGKKKRHTQKTQIAIDAKTKQVLATFFGPGRQHDFRLWKESRFHVAPSKELRVDTGYQGIKKLHANTQIPKKRRRNQPLSSEDKQENRAKAKRRMRVEQVIGHLKRFRLIAEKYRNRRRRFGLRVNLIAALYNYDLA
jgi:hypothetical protein